MAGVLWLVAALPWPVAQAATCAGMAYQIGAEQFAAPTPLLDYGERAFTIAPPALNADDAALQQVIDDERDLVDFDAVTAQAEDCYAIRHGGLVFWGGNPPFDTAIMLRGARRNRDGGDVSWQVDVGQSGLYRLVFGYRLPALGLRERVMRLEVNGVTARETVRFRASRAHAERTDEPLGLNNGPIIVHLDGGQDNEIKLTAIGPGSRPFLYYLEVRAVHFLTRGGDLLPDPDPYAPECDDPGYAASYYGEVDPDCLRSTLDDWKTANGYDGSEAEAQYVNAYDLGFGRNMTCRDNGADGAACAVENTPEPRTADNPDAADQFAVTVTMDRLTEGDASNNWIKNDKMIAFFVYDAQGRRINQAPLDLEGAKAVPESCYACHGLPNGDGAQFLPFDVDLFEQWVGTGEPLDAQAEDFRELNHIVWRDSDLFAPGGGVVELVEGWYGGEPVAGTSYDNGYQPVTWLDDVVAAQTGRATAMYHDIYAKFCRTCHVAQALRWTKATEFVPAAHQKLCPPIDDPALAIMPNALLTLAQYRIASRLDPAVDDLVNGWLCADPTTPPVLVAQETYATVLRAACGACHTATFEPYFIPAEGSNDTVHELLVDVNFGGGILVVPNDLDNSLLWQQIDQDLMPQGDPWPADDERREIISDWIQAGAPNQEN